MLCASVAFGFVAHRLSSDEAEREFHRTHRPGRGAWAQLVKTAGWNEISDPSALHRIARTLPATTDTPGSAWIDGGKEWLVIYAEADAVIPVSAWCRDCESKPRNWSALGQGWPAFDSLETLLSGIKPLERKSKAVSRQEFRDPLEIRY